MSPIGPTPDDFIIKTTDSTNINWAELTNQKFHIAAPPEMQVAPIPLALIHLDQYTEDDLQALRDRIERHLGPKPPKFNTVEEADAWMEKHHGQ